MTGLLIDRSNVIFEIKTDIYSERSVLKTTDAFSSMCYIDLSFHADDFVKIKIVPKENISNSDLMALKDEFLNHLLIEEKRIKTGEM